MAPLTDTHRRTRGGTRSRHRSYQGCHFTPPAVRCAGMRRAGGRWLFVALLAALLLFLVSRLGGAWRAWRQPAAKWAGLDSCPFCYGRDACEALQSDVRLTVESASALVALLGDKNAVEGRRRSDDRKLALKRLGHDWELRRLDARVCEPFPDDCDYDSVEDLHDTLVTAIKRLISVERLRLEPDEVGFAMCPETDRISEVLDAQMRSDEEPNSPLNKAAMLNSWTMMNINAEPLLLKYLSTDDNDWPVPEFLGACGRVIIESHAGEPLSSYVSSSLSTRAQIAIGLLEAADSFTFDHPDFRFYLTDVDVDNIAVNETSLRPIFIDLENVILLDKNANSTNQRQNHSSEVLDCPGCFAFSVDDICSYGLSDHNHYAICSLIANDLLKANAVRKMSPKLLDLLSECVSPLEGTDRFGISRLLREELETLVDVYE